ncbi:MULTISPECIES: hypothetical protein [unclassified Caballeronia]|uniref:hypothetical protein n=1 Tax=unclassified Caballeronia TaxID=2646786 RepID=UPI001F1D466D|nr:MULTISPECIES: hypothetical protein [unclassified Caballeronia]MCE4544630.1 hypothetical protein [Caballeronia sp. PC1]MCE4571782.1 hypothetical protein [Caballeronia sp. CLC5]
MSENKKKRCTARAALDRYQAAANPPAALVHELLGAVAAMVAADTDRKISYVVDGYALVREPVSLYGRRGSGA